jgi:hypothetical protein
MKSQKHIHRNYFFLLSAVMCLLILAMFKFKISYTMSVKEDLNATLQQVIEARGAREKLDNLKAMTGVTTNERKKMSQEELQQHLLDGLTTLGLQNHVGVTGISGGEESGSNGYAITSFDVTLHGDYVNIIRLIQKFENENTQVRLASVRFASRMNRQTKRRELNAYLHIQQLSHA